MKNLKKDPIKSKKNPIPAEKRKHSNKIEYHKPWFVYILECENNSFYTGIAIDPEKRFIQHSLGKGAKYTRIHKPIRIVYIEQKPSHGEALKREYQIKKMPHRQKEKLIQLT